MASLSEQEPRIVVALNFGTTHTSVAYLVDRDQNNTDIQEKIKEIRTIRNWPCVMNEFVPSEISYSPTNKGCQQWGYDIDDGSHVHKGLRQQLEEKSRLDELMQLRDLVQEANTNTDLAFSVPPLLHKSPESMAGDYLRNVVERFRDDFETVFDRRVLENLPLDLVVSYPSLWPPIAKRRSFRVIESVFDRTILPTIRHIFFVAEEDAVSHWCVFTQLNLWKNYGVRKGTSLIMCDTEGSAVQAVATSYAVDQMEPEFKLRKIGYLAPADAGWQSIEDQLRTFLIFKRHFSPHLFLEESDSAVRSPWRAVLDRFQRTMYGFDDRHQLQHAIQLPIGFADTDDPANGIMHGKLILSNDDLKQMFEPSIESLIQILSHQIELADQAGTPVKVLLLNGSFVNHKYTSRRLENFARRRGISVVKVEYSGNIARGSVLHALGVSMTPISPVTRLQHHYGVSWVNSDLKLPNGERENIMSIEWVLNRGDVVFPGEDESSPQSVRMERTYQAEDFLPGRMFKVVIAVCSQDIPSSHFQNLETTSTQTIDLEFDGSLIPDPGKLVVEHVFTENQKGRFKLDRKKVKRVRYCTVVLSVSFQVIGSTVTIRVACGDTLLAERHVPD
ncbi:hypothetical protein V8F20_006222 [Naviculisporaceae sp. PSN 640]